MRSILTVILFLFCCRQVFAGANEPVRMKVDSFYVVPTDSSFAFAVLKFSNRSSQKILLCDSNLYNSDNVNPALYISFFVGAYMGHYSEFVFENFPSSLYQGEVTYDDDRTNCRFTVLDSNWYRKMKYIADQRAPNIKLQEKYHDKNVYRLDPGASVSLVMPFQVFNERDKILPATKEEIAPINVTLAMKVFYYQADKLYESTVFSPPSDLLKGYWFAKVKQ